MDGLTVFGLALLMLLGAFFVFILINTLNDVLKVHVALYRRKKLVRRRTDGSSDIR